ncbi:MAG: BMP family ABC transporter substrate-binding protein [Spirochaetes bacterium]|nr:BMP family ABC transporter substrate-binding protein [Spirochaetota bacterium]MBU1080285.1 BMP family ABC transporter substrate-binding protein [Spirochaetota bacterium]
MKRILAIALAACLVAVSCSKPAEKPAEKAKEPPLVAMTTDANGLGDGSFNDGVWAGLQKAEADGLAKAKVLESHAMTDYVPNLSGLAEDGAKLVFGVGFLMVEQIQEAAKAHPETFYAGIDHTYFMDSIPANLIGVSYKEQEAGYLAGIVAGQMTKEFAKNSPKLNDKNVIGAVLGMDIPPVERYLAGYIAGAKSVNPGVDVRYIVAGSFGDRAKGKEATIALIDQGADIVLQIAGLTGMGVIDAARERGIFAIGADVDQNAAAPEFVLTSALKGTTSSAYVTIKELAAGTLKGGVNRVFGLAEGSIDLAPFHQHDAIVPQSVKDAVAKAKAGIVDGSVKVPSALADLGIKK